MFLSSNTRTALLFQIASLAFLNNARSASNARPAFYRLQNARPVFCLRMRGPRFLTPNAMASFQQSNARPAFSIACLQDIRCQKALTLRDSKASSSDAPSTDLRDYMTRNRNVHQIAPRCHCEQLISAILSDCHCGFQTNKPSIFS